MAMVRLDVLRARWTVAPHRVTGDFSIDVKGRGKESLADKNMLIFLKSVTDLRIFLYFSFWHVVMCKERKERHDSPYVAGA